MNQKHAITDYPVHLLEYPARLAESSLGAIITCDEYLFASYFSVILQAVKLSEHEIADEFFRKMERKLEGHFNMNMVERLTLKDSESRSHMMKVIENLKFQFNETIHTNYLNDFFISVALFYAIKEYAKQHKVQSHEVMREVVKETIADKLSVPNATSIVENISWLKNLLKMNRSEQKLVELSLMMSTDARMAIFRDTFYSIEKTPAIQEMLITTMLGFDEASKAERDEIYRSLTDSSIPIKIGMIDYNSRQKRLNRITQFWATALSQAAESSDAFFKRFTHLVTERKKSFSGAIARVGNEQDESMFKSLLENINSSSEGVNVLFYGSDRLDKIGYLYDFIKKSNLDVWQVNVKDLMSSDVPGVVYISQMYLASVRNTINPFVLLIPKAEQALSRQRVRFPWLDMFDEGGDDPIEDEEATADELLLNKNPIPAIWVVSNPGMITAENVGRFLFHCELKGGTRADRKGEIEKVVNEFNLSPELIQQLSMYFQLNTEQIRSAVKMTDLIKVQREQIKEPLLHLISNSQQALNRTETENLRECVTKYSLDNLNINGNLPIEKIIECLKRKPIASICFHGLPGTGKTQLAEYIAVQLDKPLLIKPASELISKWLGETEQNIAKAFAEAQAEDAVFLLDEADSFMRDRSSAERSWEVTQVNELLQKMERFKGTFICATNLFKSIDAAALRRFTFKLEFLALQPLQILNMLMAECNFDYKALTVTKQHELQMRIGSMQHLTPGDFATVKRQALMLDEQLTLDEFMNRLDAELKAKSASFKRNDNYMTVEEGARPILQAEQNFLHKDKK